MMRGGGLIRRAVGPVSRRWLGTITHVVTNEPVVALTFDDGPHPVYTPLLLDCLAAHGAKATFFVTGTSAAAHPMLIDRMSAEGHAIGNHSWDHPDFFWTPAAVRRQQLHACERAIGRRPMRLFRPPYGSQSLGSRLQLWWHGYKVVTWNVVGFDWQENDADTILGHIEARLQPGSVILLHDRLYTAEKHRYGARGATLSAVEQLLERVGSTYRFVTVPELLRRGRPVYRHWFRHSDRRWLATLVHPDGSSGETS